MDSTFFKGTSTEQDRRFSDKELRLLRTLKFPPEFEQKVDLKKVNMAVMRPWITNKVIEFLGFEDEVVVEYAMGLLEDPNASTVDPRKMQINLTGFLESKTADFIAQESIGGIPAEFLEAKKAELRERQLTDSRTMGEVDRRASEAQRGAPRLDEFRGDGRGRGRGRGGFGGRGDFGGRGGFGGGRDDFGGGGRGAQGERDSGWGARARGRGGYGGQSDRPRFDDRDGGRDRSPPPYRRRRSPDDRDRPPAPRRSSPPRRRSPTESPPPRKRRSPSITPPRRRRSPSETPPRRSRRDRSDSRSPDRGRDRSPPRRRRSPSHDSDSDASRSPTPDRRRRPSPPRRSGRDRTPPHSAGKRDGRGRVSRSPSPDGRKRSSRRQDNHDSDDEREVKRPRRDGPSVSPVEKKRGEAKKNGTAAVLSHSDPAKAESELKEKLLRQKVVKSRKSVQSSST
ncbi:hypothetical protein CALVIDRAFT_546370 [Calocera viscosa TUFC12733]|uniref:PWI domain-containing protein n=1 Tax=Calocera viscosa (strain TUFC12733) TaxID=1330018 RepID=A0A167K1R8_CALVF|nr:hypothetical protein CALVIDRAFT_546370 [Calocera viscosa TUFC12733]